MMKSENTARRVDAIGRITLPKGLRDRMCITENEELELFTTEENGKEFICLSKKTCDYKYLMAKAVLEELGAEIPEELLNACEES